MSAYFASCVEPRKVIASARVRDFSSFVAFRMVCSVASSSLRAGFFANGGDGGETIWLISSSAARRRRQKESFSTVLRKAAIILSLSAADVSLFLAILLSSLIAQRLPRTSLSFAAW